MAPTYLDELKVQFHDLQEENVCIHIHISVIVLFFQNQNIDQFPENTFNANMRFRS